MAILNECQNWNVDLFVYDYINTTIINVQIYIPVLVVIFTVITQHYQFSKLAIIINMSTATGARWILDQYTGLFEMIVGVLTTCHTQYTRDSGICVFFIQ